MVKNNNGKVVMLVKNTFTHDARVMRSATALVEVGYSVYVICLLGPGLQKNEIVDEVKVIRIKRGVGNKIRSLSDAKNQTSEKSNFSKILIATVIKITRRIGDLWIREILEKLTDYRMIKIALNLSPNIIHAHDLDTLSAGVYLKNKLKIPLIYDSHEMATGRNLASNRRQIRAFRTERKLINNPDKIIMASQGYANRAIELYGIKNPTVLLNVPEIIKPFETESYDLRKKLDFAKDEILLVYQGIILPNRGIDQIIDALSLVGGVSLAVLGYGQHRPFLESKVKKLNLNSRVKFFGPLDSKDLIRWSSSADFGLCTIVGKSESYKYSMPNKLFEYLQAGLPIIVSDYDGMGTFVKQNEIGFTCDPENTQRIAELIGRLKKVSLDTYSKNIKKTAELYNWEAEKSKLYLVYSELNFKAS